MNEEQESVLTDKRLRSPNQRHSNRSGPEARSAARHHRRVDRHHPAAAVRHHHTGAGVRHPDRVHGGHAAHRRSSAGGQTGLCARRSDQQVRASFRRGEARRHHRVPVSDGYQADVREAGDRRSRRSHPDGEQAGVRERREAERAVQISQDRVHRFLPRQLPRASRMRKFIHRPSRCCAST